MSAIRELTKTQERGMRILCLYKYGTANREGMFWACSILLLCYFSAALMLSEAWLVKQRIFPPRQVPRT